MVHKFEELLSRNSLVAPIIIGMFVFITFIFSLPNSFVLDDPSQVLTAQVVSFDIPHIFGGSSFGVQGTSSPAGQYYKPLMTTSFAVLYKVFGTSPAPFHLFQIMVHLGCAILVFFLFKRFFNPTLSLILALIFAIHPFSSEVVLYISDLQDPLFFFFGISAFLLATKRNLKPLDVVLSVILLGCSLFSKETGIIFLVMIFLYRALFIHGAKKLLELAVTYGIFLAFFIPIRLAAVGVTLNTDAPYPIMRLSLLERLINVPAMIFYYIRNFFAPFDFAMAQHWNVKTIDVQNFYLPLFADILFFTIILFFFVLLVMKKSTLRPAYVFFTLWFILGLFMHLNIYPLDATVADRWFYFPSVGLLGILGIIMVTLGLSKKNLFVVLMFILILVLSVRTMVRTFDWRNGLTLATRDIKYSHNSFPLENNLAFELINAGRYDEALIHEKKSVELGSWWWLNWNNLGVIYRHKGYTEDKKFYKNAETYFRRAIKNGSSFYLPYENLAELLTHYDTPQNAQKFLVETSKKMPLSGKMFFDLAIVQLQLKDKKGALQAANQARILLPNDQAAQLLYQAIKAGKDITIQKPAY